jgi:membrane-associated phospholipid phosphatase
LLALIALSLLAADDTPQATALVPPEPVEQKAWLRPSARQFPRPSLLKFLENTGLSMTRVVRPELTDVFVIVPGLIGTAVALNTDVATHSAIMKIPNPQLGPARLAGWVSYLGEGWVDLAVFAALAVVGGRDEQRAALAGVQAMLAVAVTSRIGKVAFREERPQVDPNEKIYFSSRVLQADSMPSGHTMSAFATAAVLSSEYPKASPIFYALATWVALARVQESTHWISDCVVGAALGLLIGWESWRVTRAFEVEVQPWAAVGGGGVQIARRW